MFRSIVFLGLVGFIVTPDARALPSDKITVPELLDRVEPQTVPLPSPLIIRNPELRLQITVDPTGKVDDIKVLRSVQPRVDRAWVAAVKQWRYKPAMRNGTAIQYKIKLVTWVHAERWPREAK